MEDLIDEYISTLSKEILLHKDKKFRTVFIGGGTPTFLSLNNLKVLLESVNQLELCKDVEFTVEGNPGTFTKEKLKLLKDIGVNRLSIGLQAWQDDLLNKIGRIHTIQEFIESYNFAREVGFNNINIDLMFGLPYQKQEDWWETLKNIVKLNPEHISCYSLIIEEGTPFYNMYKKGIIKLPMEEDERAMYKYTLDYLNKNGYHQYEISNFAKEYMECKHNVVYWNLEEYIGCGVAAHSYLNGYRYRNLETVYEYIDKIEHDEMPILESYKNSEKDDMEEYMFMGLRKIKGINKKEFERRFSQNIYDVYGNVIYKYIKSGLIIDSGETLALSPRGIEVSNVIMADFILD
jgi:oxygen-independent coproporphyrinogen-3 oxidase